MKKLAAGVLSLALSSSMVLAGCSSDTSSGSAEGSDSAPKATETKTIKVANWYADDHGVNIALNEKFKTLVEKNSNGTLKVEIYSNSKLGGEEQMYDSVRAGTLEVAVISAIIEPEVPKVSTLSLPFLFRDLDHAQNVLKGEIGQEIAAQIEENTGVKLLGYGINGFRVFSSNKPLEKIEDFKGYRVRMPNVPQMIAVGQNLGATVTPMPISEVFSALEQHVVDGQDNPYATLRANAWYEVQSHVLESNHIFLPHNIIMNKKFWDGLTPEEQKVVQDAMTESAAYEWELYRENEEKDKEFLKEKGLEIIVPDENFKNQMIDATKGIYDEFYKNNSFGEEIVNKIRNS